MSRLRRLFLSFFASHSSSQKKFYIIFPLFVLYDNKIFQGVVPNGQLGDRSTDRNNLELCLPSSCFCPLSQKVAQALQTFLTVLLRVRWQVWNIAAWWCVSVGHSDGLDCPLRQQDKGSSMALCPFKGKKEYEYFLHSKVYRTGFLLARSTLSFRCAFWSRHPCLPCGPGLFWWLELSPGHHLLKDDWQGS